MPKIHTNMAHNSRSMPYPIFPEVPSSRSFATADYTSTNHERPSAAWTSEDDNQLMQLRTQGMNWGPIAAHFHGKTPNACRKRHERLMEKKNAESWDDGIRIEDLARAYLQVREQMWKILAEALGEKWQTVETKCMEKGLKTLTTAGRAALRHDTSKQSTPPISHRSESEFDDASLVLPMDVSSGTPNNAGAILSSQHLSAYHYPNTIPSQRQASVSSTGSIINANMQAANAMNMAQVIPMQAYNYSAAPQLYNTTQTASPTYMSTGFTPNNFAAYAQPQGLTALNRGYESVPISRSSPNTIPALPPPASLLGPSRSHREPITASF